MRRSLCLGSVHHIEYTTLISCSKDILFERYSAADCSTVYRQYGHVSSVRGFRRGRMFGTEKSSSESAHPQERQVIRGHQTNERSISLSTHPRKKSRVTLEYLFLSTNSRQLDHESIKTGAQNGPQRTHQGQLNFPSFLSTILGSAFSLS